MIESDRRLEIAMGNMLRIGVTIAALVVLAGGVLYLTRSQGSIPDYQHFHGSSQAYTSMGAIASGASRFDGPSLIEFGILLLIATPICRVMFGLVGFALLKDRLYTTISAILLTILLLSFFSKR
jgi:uncharacterized membrane protein